MGFQACPVDLEGPEVRVGLQVQNRGDPRALLKSLDVDLMAWARADEDCVLDTVKINQAFTVLSQWMPRVGVKAKQDILKILAFHEVARCRPWNNKWRCMLPTTVTR